jgi:RNA polymerase sigma-70 factor (ECF subfamily)
MDIEDELRIVESAQHGDMSSFSKLYEHYYTTMVWLAYSVLKDYSLAEDAAQEAFACACNELTGLRRPEKFSSWLAAICRNVAYQMAKNRKREVIVNEPPMVLEQSSDHSPEKAVRQAIASLPKIYREIVILRYYNRMSYEQMEMVLDIPKSKVKGRLFAARLKIRKYLHRKGLDGDY